MIERINGWSLVILVTLVLVVYQLLAPGMFFDGLTYASISENYSESSSFWELHYTKTLRYEFYEHPPLAFYLQNLFYQTGFKENSYCLLMLLFSFYFIAKIFILSGGSKKMAWVPVLFFVSTPIVFWSYSNNMLENTLTVFVLFCCWSILSFLKNNSKPFLFILSGVITAGCFLVKGPVGLFPMAIIPLHWIFINQRADIKSYLKIYSFYIFGIFLTVSMLLLNQNALDFFSRYLNEQVLASVQGNREVSNSRFYILIQLFLEIGVMMGITLLLFLTKFKYSFSSTHLFFLLIGLSASLPILISSKQLGFYLVPSIPFFAIAFSLMISEKVMNFLQNRILSLVLVSGLIVTIVFVFIQAPNSIRDKDKFEMINYLVEEKQVGETIAISKSLESDWALHAYLYRFAKISLGGKADHGYLILKKDEKPPNHFLRYQEIGEYAIYTSYIGCFSGFYE